MKGGIKVNGFRPYFGIGWGRTLPNKLVNFGIELGAVSYTHLDVYKRQPNNRLVTIDLNKPSAPWVEIVPEQKEVLTSAQFADDKLILSYEKDAATHLYVHKLDGTKEREIALPTFGTASVSSDKGDKDVFYTFKSFVYPSACLLYTSRCV